MNTQGALQKLLNPQSVAVIGGGVWGRSVIEQCRKLGFRGEIFVVHPTADEVEGLCPLRRIEDLPVVPDACFIGVNRQASIQCVAQLAQMGAGGAVCFASGFMETADEGMSGAALQDALVKAAGAMPILGPNCYGFVNYLDRFCLWPDQHGGVPSENGVAIIAQSSNVMINITMQKRRLPIAYALTVGNQAQLSFCDLGRAVLQDPRVTALGLYLESIGDLADFEALAQAASAMGKAIVIVKTGRSEQARQAAISHTASLTGNDMGADLLFARLGIARVDGLSAFVETLKILHFEGKLPGARVASLSCSGGEASLIADTAHLRPKSISFPPLTEAQKNALHAVLGDIVALANPLDYHTFVWGDVAKMADAYTAMLAGPVDIGVIVVDFPRADRCDPAAWNCIIDAACLAKERVGKPIALLSTMVENMPEAYADAIIARGLIPLCGMEEGVAAIAAAATLPAVSALPVLTAIELQETQTLFEAEAKSQLAEYGLDIPQNVILARDPFQGDLAFDYPFVLKQMGAAHKTEIAGVRLGITSKTQLIDAMNAMGQACYLVEEMVVDPIAELLVGVIADPVHGFIMTLGAGGVHTEILDDHANLLLPVSADAVDDALSSLRMAPIFDGYRGAPAVDKAALIRAIMAVQAYVMDHANALAEIEINPLILTKTRAVAVDALIRREAQHDQ